MRGRDVGGYGAGSGVKTSAKFSPSLLLWENRRQWRELTWDGGPL
jgi:hypothetical protein